MRKLLLAVLLLPLVWFVPSGAAGARPRALTCGMSVTHSIKLRADLACGVGNGLVVTRSNVTIRLNGHALTGGGGGFPIDQGISNTNDRLHSIKIVGPGRILNFADSEISLRGKRMTVKDVVVGQGTNGVVIIGSRARVTGVTSFQNLYGFGITGTRNVISDVQALQSSTAGFVIGGSRDALRHALASSDGAGIDVTAKSSSVSDSVAVKNSNDGVDVSGTGDVLTRVVATSNGGRGINAPTATGSGNTAFSNVNTNCTAGSPC